MDESDIVNIRDYQLRRNAIAFNRRAPPAQRTAHWLDLISSDIVQFFNVRQPMRPRLASNSEIWFSTTALNSHGNTPSVSPFTASSLFYNWTAWIKPPEPQAPKPRPKITVFDRHRERTEMRGDLRLL